MPPNWLTGGPGPHRGLASSAAFRCPASALPEGDNALFLAGQTIVWVDLLQQGLYLDSGIYGSLFYTLTVFHALHVLVGLGLLASLLPGALSNTYTPKKHGRLHVIGMFWHFVDLVWFLIFVSLYLL